MSESDSNHSNSSETETQSSEPVKRKSDQAAVDEVMGLNGDKKKSKGGGFFAFAAFLFAGSALAASWYVWQDSQLQVAELEKKITAEKTENTHQRKDNRDLTTQLQVLDKRLAEQDKKQNNLTVQLERQQQLIAQWRTSSASDWKLAEAEHLLSLANEQLMIQRKSQVAVKILERVDDVLVATEDRSVKSVRQAVANDLQKIKAAGFVDIDGIYARLDAAIDGLNKLPLVSKKMISSQEKETSAADLSWWQDFEEVLGKYIQIRRLDKPVKPLISPEQELFLRNNLRLNLEQAQLALLKGQSGVYKQSLLQASQWVYEHFDAKDSSVKAMVKTLNDLSALPVAQDDLNVDQSIVALKRFTALRNKAALNFMGPKRNTPIKKPANKKPVTKKPVNNAPVSKNKKSKVQTPKPQQGGRQQ